MDRSLSIHLLSLPSLVVLSVLRHGRWKCCLCRALLHVGLFVSFPRWLWTAHTHTEPAVGQQTASHSGGCAQGYQLAGPACQGACQTPGYYDWRSPLLIYVESVWAHKAHTSKRGSELVGALELRGWRHARVRCHLKQYSSSWNIVRISLALIASTNQITQQRILIKICLPVSVVGPHTHEHTSRKEELQHSVYLTK